MANIPNSFAYPREFNPHDPDLNKDRLVYTDPRFPILDEPNLNPRRTDLLIGRLAACLRPPERAENEDRQSLRQNRQIQATISSKSTEEQGLMAEFSTFKQVLLSSLDPILDNSYNHCNRDSVRYMIGRDCSQSPEAIEAFIQKIAKNLKEDLGLNQIKQLAEDNHLPIISIIMERIQSKIGADVLIEIDLNDPKEKDEDLPSSSQSARQQCVLQ